VHPRQLAVALAVAALVVLADQVTKSVAVSHLARPTHVIGPFGLALSYNSGSAFSLFAGHSALVIVVAIGLVVALVVGACWTSRTSVAVALGLVLGGALGNLTDRALRGHHGQVVDFITFPHWPTFNVADSCITVGVLLLVIFLWKSASDAPGKPEKVEIP